MPQTAPNPTATADSAAARPTGDGPLIQAGATPFESDTASNFLLPTRPTGTDDNAVGVTHQSSLIS
jgi:hypothetical protein